MIALVDLLSDLPLKAPDPCRHSEQLQHLIEHLRLEMVEAEQATDRESASASACSRAWVPGERILVLLYVEKRPVHVSPSLA